jgi:hypothetical protein
MNDLLPDTKNLIMRTMVLRYSTFDGNIISKEYGMTSEQSETAINKLRNSTTGFNELVGFIWLETAHEILGINLQHFVSANFLFEIGLPVYEPEEDTEADISVEEYEARTPEEHLANGDWPGMLYFDRPGVAPASMDDDSDWFGCYDMTLADVLDIAEQIEWGDTIIAFDDNDGEPLFIKTSHIAMLVISKAEATEDGGSVAQALAEALQMDIGLNTYQPAAERAGAKSLTFDELCYRELRLGQLRDEVIAIQDDPEQPYFCANEAWYAPDGPKRKLMRLVGPLAERSDLALQSIEAYNVACDTLYDMLPPCRNCWCISGI